MDNRIIDVTSQGQEALALAVQLAWMDGFGDKVSHYKEINLVKTVVYVGSSPTNYHYTDLSPAADGVPTLILARSYDAGMLPLPYPMSMNEAIPFVYGWLKNANPGPQPDHDGHNEEGWRLFNTNLSGGAECRNALFAVQPVWAMYGK